MILVSWCSRHKNDMVKKHSSNFFFNLTYKVFCKHGGECDLGQNRGFCYSPGSSSHLRVPDNEFQERCISFLNLVPNFHLWNLLEAGFEDLGLWKRSNRIHAVISPDVLANYRIDQIYAYDYFKLKYCRYKYFVKWTRQFMQWDILSSCLPDL